MIRLLGLLSPGQFDAGFAALGSLLVGVAAVRILTPEALGAYAVLFAALTLAAELPTQLAFVPSEVLAIESDREWRVGVLSASLPRGGLAALGGAALVPLAIITMLDQLPSETLAPLTVTAAAVALLSPIQDHLRRLLHLAHLSWFAAVVSVVHVGIAASALFALRRSGLPTVWVPFGALALANAGSLLVALSLAYRPWRAGVRRVGLAGWRQLASIGRWLLLLGVISSGTSFAVNALVVALAGASQAGFAEGARVVARPIQVVAIGALAVLGPRLMEAATAGDLRRAARLRGGFVALITAGTLLYSVAVVPGWGWNPLEDFLPNAYAVTGLVGLGLVANAIGMLSYPFRSELMGVRRQRELVRAEVPAGVAQVAVAGLATRIGAYAVPLAALAAGLVRWRWYSRAVRSIYVDHPRKDQE